jgi:hypothetical protein
MLQPLILLARRRGITVVFSDGLFNSSFEGLLFDLGLARAGF